MRGDLRTNLLACQEERWHKPEIQMQQLPFYNNNQRQRFKQQQPYQMHRMLNQGFKHPQRNYNYQQFNQNSNYNNFHNNNLHHQSQFYKNYVEQPYIPQIIQMNGLTFVRTDENNELKPQNKQNIMKKKYNPNKNKIPSMNVTCTKCKTIQLVGADQKNYMCCQCFHKNNNQALYDRFVCYNCHVKVKYCLKSSGFIKCTRCQSVNKVQIPANNKVLDFYDQQNDNLQEELLYDMI